MITFNDVERTYNGKVGCTCGCQGKYNDDPKTFKAALTRMLNSDYKVEFFHDGTGCLFNRSSTRTNVVYFKKNSLDPKDVPVGKISH